MGGGEGCVLDLALECESLGPAPCEPHFLWPHRRAPCADATKQMEKEGCARVDQGGSALNHRLGLRLGDGKIRQHIGGGTARCVGKRWSRHSTDLA